MLAKAPLYHNNYMSVYVSPLFVVVALLVLCPFPTEARKKPTSTPVKDNPLATEVQSLKQELEGLKATLESTNKRLTTCNAEVEDLKELLKQEEQEIYDYDIKIKQQEQQMMQLTQELEQTILEFGWEHAAKSEVINQLQSQLNEIQQQAKARRECSQELQDLRKARRQNATKAGSGTVPPRVPTTTTNIEEPPTAVTSWTGELIVGVILVVGVGVTSVAMTYAFNKNKNQGDKSTDANANKLFIERQRAQRSREETKGLNRKIEQCNGKIKTLEERLVKTEDEKEALKKQQNKTKLMKEENKFLTDRVDDLQARMKELEAANQKLKLRMKKENQKEARNNPSQPQNIQTCPENGPTNSRTGSLKSLNTTFTSNNKKVQSPPPSHRGSVSRDSGGLSADEALSMKLATKQGQGSDAVHIGNEWAFFLDLAHQKADETASENGGEMSADDLLKWRRGSTFKDDAGMTSDDNFIGSDGSHISLYQLRVLGNNDVVLESMTDKSGGEFIQPQQQIDAPNVDTSSDDLLSDNSAKPLFKNQTRHSATNSSSSSIERGTGKGKQQQQQKHHKQQQEKQDESGASSKEHNTPTRNKKNKKNSNGKEKENALPSSTSISSSNSMATSSSNSLPHKLSHTTDDIANCSEGQTGSTSQNDEQIGKEEEYDSDLEQRNNSSIVIRPMGINCPPSSSGAAISLPIPTVNYEEMNQGHSPNPSFVAHPPPTALPQHYYPCNNSSCTQCNYDQTVVATHRYPHNPGGMGGYTNNNNNAVPYLQHTLPGSGESRTERPYHEKFLNAHTTPVSFPQSGSFYPKRYGNNRTAYTGEPSVPQQQPRQYRDCDFGKGNYHDERDNSSCRHPHAYPLAHPTYNNHIHSPPTTHTNNRYNRNDPSTPTTAPFASSPPQTGATGGAEFSGTERTETETETEHEAYVSTSASESNLKMQLHPTLRTPTRTKQSPNTFSGTASSKWADEPWDDDDDDGAALLAEHSETNNNNNGGGGGSGGAGGGGTGGGVYTHNPYGYNGGSVNDQLQVDPQLLLMHAPNLLQCGFGQEAPPNSQVYGIPQFGLVFNLPSTITWMGIDAQKYDNLYIQPFNLDDSELAKILQLTFTAEKLADPSLNTASYTHLCISKIVDVFGWKIRVLEETECCIGGHRTAIVRYAQQSEDTTESMLYGSNAICVRNGLALSWQIVRRIFKNVPSNVLYEQQIEAEKLLSELVHTVHFLKEEQYAPQANISPQQHPTDDEEPKTQ